MVAAERLNELAGLSQAQVEERRRRFGPNALPEVPPRLLRLFLRKFTAPVAMMLEATLVLELVLGRLTQGMLIGALLVLNAIISFFQERRASSALAELRRGLAVGARVLRDGVWSTIPAQELVPDDVVYLRAGDIVPADLRLLDGAVAADASALTGESLPAELTAGASAFSGTIVRRGEATGLITAIGSATAYGKTAELVQTAQPRGHIEKTVLGVVKYLVVGDTLLAIAVILHALATHSPVSEALPFALMLLIASVPVALPATFSLAMAMGARTLARKGVLVTRLAAAEDVAAMSVLCTDKTGTLTENKLSLHAIQGLGVPEEEVLRFALWACDEATQDPIDLAILAAARERQVTPDAGVRSRFVPFDPATKRAEAFVRSGAETWRVMKGAPRALAEVLAVPVPLDSLNRLAKTGCRVVAVAAGPENSVRLLGLLALRDAPRPDAAVLVSQLRELNVQVVMISGDDVATARAVSIEVGIGSRAATAGSIRSASDEELAAINVFGGVSPTDKFELVKRLQGLGHVTGMTGDGVNDAAALKQAESGIAMSNATDVAKGAASMVLTEPGLVGVVEAIKEGRAIYRRMVTYTVNKIVKTFHLSLLLSIGVIGLHAYVTTPRQLVLLLFLNDFLTMSLSVDHASWSRRPARWDLFALSRTGIGLSLVWTVFSFVVWFVGQKVFLFTLPQCQTLIFVLLVLTSQATIYLLRSQAYLWRARPSLWLVLSSIGGLMAASAMAGFGLFMAAMPWSATGLLLASTLGLTLMLNVVKVSSLRLRRAKAPSVQSPSLEQGLA